MTAPYLGPLRPSEIKAAIYGRSGLGGLRFNRVLYAGWEFQPAPGIVAKHIHKFGMELARGFRTPLVTAVNEIMTRSIFRNFQAGGRPTPWEPLADYTVKVRGTTGPILIRSGALQRAASSFEVWTITNDSASIRKLPADVWYGNLHQAGYGSVAQLARKILGSRARQADVEEMGMRIALGIVDRPPSVQSKIVIPERPFALFQQEDIEDIQDIFIDWMERRADAAGRGWNPR